MADSWKLTLRCTRAEAEAIDADLETLAGIDPPPVLMTSEAVADDPSAWRLDAYFAARPDAAAIAAVCALVPSAGARPRPERIADADWVTMSQAGIEPVRAGRFYVHTGTNGGVVPAGSKAFQIGAGLAFGTGTHATTAGCLAALDALKARGARFGDLLDLGTGTGLLAFAAMHLWPRARAVASDIDPQSIETVRENAAINGVRLGQGPGELSLAVASGLDHRTLIQRAPYDLVIANILAGPLIALAPTIAAAMRGGGTLLLAGLLAGQAETVARAYRRQGLRLAERTDHGDWPTLRLVKRVRHGRERVTRRSSGRAETPGFGSW